MHSQGDSTLLWHADCLPERVSPSAKTLYILRIMAKNAIRMIRKEGMASPIAAVSTAVTAAASPTRGRLSPWTKMPFSDPIHPPVGQRHECQQHREITDDGQEEDIRDVVARDPNQGSLIRLW